MNQKLTFEKQIVLPKISGSNLRYNLNVDFKTKSYSVFLHDWGTEKEEEKNYQFYKERYVSGQLRICQIKIDINLFRFVEHFLYDAYRLLKFEEISIELFVNQTYNICIEYFEYISNKKEADDFTLYCQDLLHFYSIYAEHSKIFNFIQTGGLLYSFGEIHALELTTKKRFITSRILLKHLKINSYLNSVVYDKIDVFHDYLENKLDSIYNGHYSFWNAIFNDLRTVQEINSRFPKKFDCSNVSTSTAKEKRISDCKNYINTNIDNGELKKLNNAIEYFSNAESTKFIKKIWNNGALGCRFDESAFTSTNRNVFFVHYIEDALQKIFLSIVLGSQSEFRESIGLPKIGQGWVSETNLFNAVKSYFEREQIIQHASPKWLGRQHLDIYFPELNIGIEYQGKQHNEPIDFFGGVESFQKTIERDLRKKQLCNENNCILLFVYPETKTDDFILELESIVNARNKY